MVERRHGADKFHLATFAMRVMFSHVDGSHSYGSLSVSSKERYNDVDENSK